MHAYTDRAVAHALSLLAIPSPTGYTGAVSTFLTETLRGMGLDPVRTPKGNVWACLGGEGSPLVLSAHVDTLGAMVRSVKEDGRLRLTPVGGLMFGSVEGENVVVHLRGGATLTGVMQITHPAAHVYEDARTQPRNEENMEVLLDARTASAGQTKDLGVMPGDYVSFDPRTVLTESGFLKSRHLDDKASAGILLALAEAAQKGSIAPGRKVYILFTTYEEVGHGASSGIPQDVEELIAVDMGCIGQDLSCDEYSVSICAKDSRSPYDYEVTGKLIQTAQSAGVSFAVDIYPYYGSDAAAALLAGYNVKHGLVGPGVFASHAYERTHKDALYATLALLSAYIAR